MNIIRGKIPSAQKVVIYGPEGIGKTSFAACFPDPLFIDTEGGTKHIDVARLPAPTSWTMLLEQVQEVKKENTSVCKTLVLDTADWAEQLCIKHICDKYKKSGKGLHLFKRRIRPPVKPSGRRDRTGSKRSSDRSCKNEKV